MNIVKIFTREIWDGDNPSFLEDEVNNFLDGLGTDEGVRVEWLQSISSTRYETEGFEGAQGFSSQKIFQLTAVITYPRHLLQNISK